MFPSPAFDLYDPFTMIVLGILALGLALCGPGMLLVVMVRLCNPPGTTLWSPAARARLVHREHRIQAARLARAVPARKPPATPRVPLTAAQQARYDDLRAKGWSDLAARQAAERLPSGTSPREGLSPAPL